MTRQEIQKRRRIKVVVYGEVDIGLTPHRLKEAPGPRLWIKGSGFGAIPLTPSELRHIKEAPK